MVTILANLFTVAGRAVHMSVESFLPPSNHSIFSNARLLLLFAFI
jgi:hypothetical protein